MSFVEVLVRQMSLLSLAVWSLYSIVPTIVNVLCGPERGAGGGHNLGRGEIAAVSLSEGEIERAARLVCCREAAACTKKSRHTGPSCRDWCGVLTGWHCASELGGKTNAGKCCKQVMND